MLDYGKGMNRFGEIVFALLLAAPLVSLSRTGPDTLRVPYVALLLFLLSLRVIGGALQNEKAEKRSSVQGGLLLLFLFGLGPSLR